MGCGILLFFLIGLFKDGKAQWSVSPLVNYIVCNAANYQSDPQIVADGSGGVIIVWPDFRSGVNDIYAQRLNSAGIPQWTSSGVLICGAANAQTQPQLISDGMGGAIITWTDSRNGSNNNDIYAQRINSAGLTLWTSGGVSLCTITGDQDNPQLVSDGLNGAIITWKDKRGGSGTDDIYARRINASGVPQWTANGVALCTATFQQLYPQIVSDGAGGAIVSWYDYRSNSVSGTNIYTQRINSTGIPQWTTNGVAVCTSPNNQVSPKMAIDNLGGVFISWRDYRSGTYSDIYMQHLNSAGTISWTTNGVPISTATYDQIDPEMIPDGSGGALVVWNDGRFGSFPPVDVYAQRINNLGIVQWTLNGVAISTAANIQNSPKITSDGSGGAIICWQDYRASSSDVYAQRINASGIVQWTVNGVALSTNIDDQQHPQIASDGAGGAIITWDDTRNYAASNYDIYAQNICAGGTLGTASTTTTVTACNNYIWPVNGQTYTASGTYQTGAVCNTQILQLTIVPSTITTNTISACQSYTWPTLLGGNGQTYNASGNYTHVNGCDTQILVLTILPLPLIGASSSMANPICDSTLITFSGSGGLSYIWSGPQAITNGNTFLASNTYAGTYTVTGTDANGCSNTSSLLLQFSNCMTSYLSLETYVQGFYMNGGMMRSVLFNQGQSNATTDCDTVWVELHEPVYPYALVTTCMGVLQTNGQLTCTFNLPASGNTYYIAIRHRNAVETWSAVPVVFYHTANYDFTGSAMQAFSSNQIEVEPGIFALYSGDMDQSGGIDGDDFNLIDPDIQSGNGGYLSTDLDGSGGVDGDDFNIFDPNVQNGVGAFLP